MNPEQSKTPKQEEPNLDRRVFCMRTGRSLAVPEHLECPYCRGNAKQVLTEIHQTFCDFDPKKDPAHFGFPEDCGRHLDA